MINMGYARENARYPYLIYGKMTIEGEREIGMGGRPFDARRSRPVKKRAPTIGMIRTLGALKNEETLITRPAVSSRSTLLLRGHLDRVEDHDQVDLVPLFDLIQLASRTFLDGKDIHHPLVRVRTAINPVAGSTLSTSPETVPCVGVIGVPPGCRPPCLHRFHPLIRLLRFHPRIGLLLIQIASRLTLRLIRLRHLRNGRNRSDENQEIRLKIQVGRKMFFSLPISPYRTIQTPAAP
ncbi:MAG: hypothetical protein MPW15_14005 [Candidatus Manganitrophus sp.]|nr:hypothetical protein [Candidatus Manganitrophus sp.]